MLTSTQPVLARSVDMILFAAKTVRFDQPLLIVMAVKEGQVHSGYSEDKAVQVYQSYVRRGLPVSLIVGGKLVSRYDGRKDGPV